MEILPRHKIEEAKALGRLVAPLFDPKLVRGALNLLVENQPLIASIDITHRCNLRCKHCYNFRGEHTEESLSDQEFLAKLSQFRKEAPTVIACIWVGGEPMARRPLLDKAITFFPYNWIATNGTYSLNGQWKNNTAFIVSIDGTQQIHDSIRGQGVYQKALGHLENATAPVAVHTVVNQQNLLSIPELVKDLTGTKAKGVFFSFHTPQKEMTENDRALFLGGEERENGVAMLLRLKEQYGDFIMMSGDQLRRFAEGREDYFGKSCPAPHRGYSLDSTFQTKRPCVMGSQADCEECGCAVPIMFGKGSMSKVISSLYIRSARNPS